MSEVSIFIVPGWIYRRKDLPKAGSQKGIKLYGRRHERGNSQTFQRCRTERFVQIGKYRIRHAPKAEMQTMSEQDSD